MTATGSIRGHLQDVAQWRERQKARHKTLFMVLQYLLLSGFVNIQSLFNSQDKNKYNQRLYNNTAFTKTKRWYFI